MYAEMLWGRDKGLRVSPNIFETNKLSNLRVKNLTEKVRRVIVI